MNKKIRAFLTEIGAYAICLFFILAPLYGAFYFFIKLARLVGGPK